MRSHHVRTQTMSRNQACLSRCLWHGLTLFRKWSDNHWSLSDCQLKGGRSSKVRFDLGLAHKRTRLKTEECLCCLHRLGCRHLESHRRMGPWSQFRRKESYHYQLRTCQLHRGSGWSSRCKSSESYLEQCVHLYDLTILVSIQSRCKWTVSPKAMGWWPLCLKLC